MAQIADPAAIGVRVADASQAVLPGASVTLSSQDRGFELQRVTDDRGEVSFNSLLPGTYKLVVALHGFTSTVLDEIRLTSYQRLKIPVEMQVGAPPDLVSVTAQPSRIDTVSALLNQALAGEAIREMPIMTGPQGRSLLAQMQLLFPGASSFRFTGMGDAYATSLSVNGSALNGVGFNVDGADNSYLFGGTGGAATVGPNPDAVEELSLLSQNFGAESGGHSSQIQWRTRSGTNLLHGQLRALVVNPNLRARDFFESDTGTGYRTRMGGAQASGPVVIPGFYNGRNRTFWFFDTEWTESFWPYPANYAFPSDAFRQGDFSSLPLELRPLDPLTGQPFPDGKIPTGRILPQSQDLMDRFIPRNPLGGQMTLIDEDRPTGYQFTTRIDHHLRGVDSLSGSLFYYRNPGASTDNSTIGNSFESLERGYNLSVQYVLGISPRATNSVTLGQTRWAYSSLLVPAETVDLALQGYGIHNVATAAQGYPNAGFDSFGISPAGYGDRQSLATFQVKDDFSLVRHSHQLKFGAEVRRGTADWLESYYGPTFAFSQNNPSGTGNDFADFLLGIPYSYSQGSDAQSYPSRLMAAIYAQDYMRLTRSLTLNLGLRYESNGSLVNRDGRNAAFRPGSQSATFANAPPGVLYSGDTDPLTGRVLDSAVTPPSRSDFGIRSGIAWSPGFENSIMGRMFGGAGRSSIRAGYGLYYTVGFARPVFSINYIQPWSMQVQLDRSMLDASHGTMTNPWGTGPDPFAGGVEQRPFYPPLTFVPLVDTDLRDAYEHQWTASFQRQLPREFAFEIAYVGNRGVHLLRTFEGNPAKITAWANPSNVESRRIYSDFGKVTGFVCDGSSLYNGMQVTFSRRFSERLLLNANYVWSKALDNSSGIGVFQLADRDVTTWARANADRRHSFAAYWVLSLPGWSRYAPIRHVTSGWRLSGSVQVRSGPPLQILNPYDSTLQGYAQTTPDIIGSFQRLDPRVVRTFKLPNGRTATGNFFFDPTAFKVVKPTGPETARLGNLGRNAFTGLGADNVDLSLARDFHLRERQRVEIRIDASNALNHAQFFAQAASTNVNNAMFGRVVGTTGPRRLQFQLRYSF